MNKKKVSKIIAYVLLAAVLIMTAGLVLTFTRGGTTSFKTFYAEHNGKKLFGDEQLSLVPEEELRFDVKYTFNALVEDEEKDYSVSIITYGTKENQFTYTVNGQPYGFDATTEVDVSDYFNLKKEEDHFTMELPNNFSMASVLGRVQRERLLRWQSLWMFVQAGILPLRSSPIMRKVPLSCLSDRPLRNSTLISA